MLGYNAARWHAVLNDLPAALLFVAVLFDLAAAWTKRESLMWAAIWTLWTGVLQELAITRMLSVVGMLGLVWTGVLGGRLVFDHAAGIPTQALQVEIENREEGHHHEPGEEHEEHEQAAPADTTKATHTHPPGTPPHSH